MEKVVIQQGIFQTYACHVVENTLRDLMGLFMMLFRCLDLVWCNGNAYIYNTFIKTTNVLVLLRSHRIYFVSPLRGERIYILFLKENNIILLYSLSKIFV